MARPLFQAEFGGQRLWLSRISTDDGRDVVVTPFTRGDVADTQDRGNKPVIARCELIFDDDVTGEVQSGVERLLALIALKNLGVPSPFTHPVYGTYFATISDFEHEIDNGTVISCHATFVPTDAVQAVSPVGSSVGPIAGLDAITSANAELSAQLDDAGLTSTLPTDIVDLVEGWLDEAQSARDTLVEFSSMSDRVWDEIATLQTDADIALWPLMKSLVMVNEALRIGADAMTGQGADSLMTVQIDGPMSLRALIASIYPIEELDTRMAEASSLNDIPTPMRIPTGTVLQLVAPPARARAA